MSASDILSGHGNFLPSGVRDTNMWPFNLWKKREASPLDRPLANLRKLAKRLASQDGSVNAVNDDEIRTAYQNIASRMLTSCDAAAQGKMAAMAELCVHAEHMTEELLADALEPVYMLGIEDLTGVQDYLRWLSSHETPYLGELSQRARQFLETVVDRPNLIVSAFESMYAREDNEWRTEDPDVPDVPPILKDRPA